MWCLLLGKAANKLRAKEEKVLSLSKNILCAMLLRGVSLISRSVCDFAARRIGENKKMCVSARCFIFCGRAR